MGTEKSAASVPEKSAELTRTITIAVINSVIDGLDN
jgi:hypothetical protein